jgi:CHASE2 domain-containing sensor protein
MNYIKQIILTFFKALLVKQGRVFILCVLGYFSWNYYENAPFMDTLGAVHDAAHEEYGPRERQSFPVTIVEIDEKSLKQVGQWPWPRNITADLINATGSYGPLAIALDFYMPEPDQTSPSVVAKNLPPGYEELAAELSKLPTNEDILAEALLNTPSILGAAGFNFETLTTSKGMRVVPPVSVGGDALPYVRQFPYVLASLPQLQGAAYSQSLLSVDADADSGLVRYIPLVSAINGDQLVPSMAFETLRVAHEMMLSEEESATIELHVKDYGIDTFKIGDIERKIQPDGKIWLHFAEADTRRYLSAVDILEGNVDPAMLENKLVLLSLSGAGLTDYRATPLGEYVPGIEIQAQVIESLIDDDFVIRPWWLKWTELAVLVTVGLFMVWAVPRLNEVLALLMTLSFDFVIVNVGTSLFDSMSILMDSETLTESWVLLFTIFEVCLLLHGKYLDDEIAEAVGATS